MKETKMLASAALAFMCTLTVAQARENCGYGIPYDQNTPPAVIAPGGDRPSARFEWGTDADTLRGVIWVWHYVTNEASAGLGVDWDKGDIHQSVWKGIPPGLSVCNRYRAGEEGVVAVRVDDQAPIIYGTYRGTQNAAVYIPDQAANQAPSPSPGAGPGPAPSKPGTEGRPKPTNSRIKSGYLDNEGKVVNVDVVVATDPTKEGFDIQVVHSTGIIVGLAELSESLSGSQRERMLAQFKQQEAGVTYATFAEYSKQNDPKVFGEMLPDDKLISLFKQRFLFFTGKTGKVTASIPADGLKTVSANLLVLEEKSLLPVLATKVNLLVPDRK